MRLLLTILLATSLSGQTDPREAKVDALFSSATQTTPGYAVAVIRDGRTVLARGYGMADLERPTPITPQTVFDIGSTSKQFTAAAVLLLEREGKLSLDDDVRKFLPDLPVYQRPVTIRHLLTHTSGIRDYLALMALSGFSSSNDYSDEETLSWIARQKALNFAPGDEHLYSNSGYYLLSQVVERAAGMSLRHYAAKHIFEPLGMTSTHFHDDPTEIVKNRALGYSPAGNGLALDMSSFHVVGDGGVYTTVEDLAKWDANFYEPKVGGRELVDALQRRGRLTSGEEIDYAAGLVHGLYRGLNTVSHGGAWAGYRAQMLRVPAHRFSVVVLSNFGAGDPGGLALKIADIYLEEQLAAAAPKPAPGAASTEPAPRVAVSVADLEKLAGLYFSEKSGIYRTLELREGKLWYVRGPGRDSELRPVTPGRFEMLGMPVAASVTFTATGALLQAEGQPDTELRRVTAAAPAAEELGAYAGEYRSDELMAPHRIALKDGKLTVRVGLRREEIALTARERDTFEGRGTIVRFQRDAAGKITGYTVSAGRVKGIRFTRVT